MHILQNFTAVFIAGFIALFGLLCNFRYNNLQDIKKRFFEAANRINWHAESFKVLYRDVQKGLKGQNIPNRSQFLNLTSEYKDNLLIDRILFWFIFIFVIIIIRSFFI